MMIKNLKFNFIYKDMKSEKVKLFIICKSLFLKCEVFNWQGL